MKKQIILGNTYKGSGLPPPLNTPSALKKEKQIRLF